MKFSWYLVSTKNWITVQWRNENMITMVCINASMDDNNGKEGKLIKRLASHKFTHQWSKSIDNKLSSKQKKRLVTIQEKHP